MPPEKASIPELRAFWGWAEAEPRARALIDVDGCEVRAGELLAASNRIVHHLRDLGLEAGDVIAVLLPNGRALLEVLLAAHQAGWYLTPINTGLTADEIAYILGDSRARALIAHERFSQQAAAAAHQARLPEAARFAIGDIPGFTPYERFAQASSEPPGDRVAGQIMQYTSGTTGRPKGVQRPTRSASPEAFYSRVAGHLTRFGIEPGAGHVHLITSPMYHTAPLVYGLSSLHFEHPLVLMDGWKAERALQLIDRHRVTITHMVPTQLKRLLMLPEEVRGRHDLSSLSHLLHAAAPCPIPIKRQILDWLGPCVWEYYAATEGGGTLASPQEWLERPGTVGRAWAGSEIRILDEAGEPVANGETGGVYMKLTSSFRYRGDEEKTHRNRRGNFFTVGDVGHLDEAGYLFLHDRKVDMIISGGVNIYPAEVESALVAHPQVQDAAVFGIPDDEWGERVLAVVEPAPGQVGDERFERELIAHCQAQIAKYKCPRSIRFVEALPRDPSGKLYKRKLRDPYWVDRDRAI